MGNELKEIREAIIAGERALRSLYVAREKLQKAGNWGLIDMFGGGTFSGLMKHGRISEAKQCIAEANRDLKVFQRELQDVNTLFDLQIDIGGLLSAFDFFFDGFLADAMVQSKISKAKDGVDRAIPQVERALSKLKSYY